MTGAATERVKKETNFTIAKQRRRRIWTAKAQGMSVYERPNDSAPVARENITARAGQEKTIVVFEDSVALASDVRAI